MRMKHVKIRRGRVRNGKNLVRNRHVRYAGVLPTYVCTRTIPTYIYIPVIELELMDDAKVVCTSLHHEYKRIYFFLFFLYVLSPTMGSSTSLRWVHYSWPRFSWLQKVNNAVTVAVVSSRREDVPNADIAVWGWYERLGYSSRWRISNGAVQVGHVGLGSPINRYERRRGWAIRNTGIFPGAPVILAPASKN